MRKNSVKNTRINGEVQRVLAEIIRGEIKDPRMIHDELYLLTNTYRLFIQYKTTHRFAALPLLSCCFFPPYIPAPDF